MSELDFYMLMWRSWKIDYSLKKYCGFLLFMGFWILCVRGWVYACLYVL